MTRSTVQCPKCGCVRGRALSCLPQPLVARLLRDRVLHSYRRGQPVFYQGNPALAVYSIHSGRVKISRERQGGEVVVGVRSSGDLLGVRAVLAELPYAVTAQALEPSIVCAIPSGTFMGLLQASSAFAIRLLKELAVEYRITEDQMVARAQERVITRTARLLSALARGTAPDSRSGQPGIRMSRDEMALRIGTTRETLSRTLNEFARDGILRLTPREIRLLDLRALLRLIE